MNYWEKGNFYLFFLKICVQHLMLVLSGGEDIWALLGIISPVSMWWCTNWNSYLQLVLSSTKCIWQGVECFFGKKCQNTSICKRFWPYICKILHNKTNICYIKQILTNSTKLATVDNIWYNSNELCLILFVLGNLS